MNKKQAIRETYDHEMKYLNAMINLIDQSPSYETRPYNSKKSTQVCWNTKELLKLRNNALYMKIDKNEQPKIPKDIIDANQVALLVYIAGIALAELGNYIVGFPTGWGKSILEVATRFRQQYIED